MKSLVFDCLTKTFQNSNYVLTDNKGRGRGEYVNEALNYFFKVKDVNHFIPLIIKEVVNKEYKQMGDLFEKFISMLQVISKINYHLFEEQILNQCQFIRLVSSLMLDSDNLKSSKSHKLRVMKALFGFIDYLVSDEMSQKHEDHVKKLLMIINDQPGLVANIIFNLNQPEKDDSEVLGFQIILIGTMCMHLRKFQKSKYMVETGTYNLIYIMRMMDNREFQLKACVAVRKATSCRVVELLDSFVRDGIIESLLEILDGFGKELLDQIESKTDRNSEE